MALRKWFGSWLRTDPPAVERRERFHAIHTEQLCRALPDLRHAAERIDDDPERELRTREIDEAVARARAGDNVRKPLNALAHRLNVELADGTRGPAVNPFVPAAGAATITVLPCPAKLCGREEVPPPGLPAECALGGLRFGERRP